MRRYKIGDHVVYKDCLCEVIEDITHVKSYAPLTGHASYVPVKAEAYKIRLITNLKRQKPAGLRKAGDTTAAFEDELQTEAEYAEYQLRMQQSYRDNRNALKAKYRANRADRANRTKQ
jgi:hypothetical protein